MLEKSYILLKYSPSRNQIVYDYIRDYYDSCVAATVVDSYDEAKFLRYTKPVIPVSAEVRNHDIEVVFEMTDDFSDNETVRAAIKVSCDYSSEYSDLYINIRERDSGKIYSYGLNIDNSLCYGEMLWMENTWSGNNISVSLVGLDHGGKYIELKDVTDEFNALF